jgi:hypothetical protein
MTAALYDDDFQQRRIVKCPTVAENGLEGLIPACVASSTVYKTIGFTAER